MVIVIGKLKCCSKDNSTNEENWPFTVQSHGRQGKQIEHMQANLAGI